MLIITRRLNQALRIGDDVVVRVMDIRRQQVRIGIEAPVDMKINREDQTPRETTCDHVREKLW